MATEEADVSCNDELERKYVAYVDAEKSSAFSSMLSVLDDDDHEDRVATYESVLFEEEVSVGVRAGVIGAANTNATVLPQVGFVADQEELAKLMHNTDRRGFLKETNVVRSQNDDEVEDEDENGKGSQAY